MQQGPVVGIHHQEDINMACNQVVQDEVTQCKDIIFSVEQYDTSIPEICRGKFLV